MSTATVCVLRDNLIMVAGIRAEMYEALRDHLREAGVDLQVIAFGDARFMDLRGAPPDVSAASQMVIDWIEAQR